MALEDEFFGRDGAGARADYLVSRQPPCPYDWATEVVILDAE